MTAPSSHPRKAHRQPWRAASYLGVFAAACLVSGCGDLPAHKVGPGPQASQPAPSQGAVYKVGVDDELEVKVWRNEELSAKVPVRPDGKISVPLIGDVQAAGKAPEEIAGEIEKKLAFYVLDPKVTVIVTALRSNEYLSRVRVTGAVEHPLSLHYRRGMTVLDIVLEAGGVNKFAAPNGTRVYRKVAGSRTEEVIPVKLGNILDKGQLSTNIELRPGDVVTVPEGYF
jgi:polysaccharide export outer membrane protein